MKIANIALLAALLLFLGFPTFGATAMEARGHTTTPPTILTLTATTPGVPTTGKRLCIVFP